MAKGVDAGGMTCASQLKESRLQLVETSKATVEEILQRAHMAARKCTCEGRDGIAAKVRTRQNKATQSNTKQHKTHASGCVSNTRAR